VKPSRDGDNATVPMLGAGIVKVLAEMPMYWACEHC
jgi:hypothetical protein